MCLKFYKQYERGDGIFGIKFAKPGYVSVSAQQLTLINPSAADLLNGFQILWSKSIPVAWKVGAKKVPDQSLV
jgi:hypothetical protein